MFYNIKYKCLILKRTGDQNNNHFYRLLCPLKQTLFLEKDLVALLKMIRAKILKILKQFSLKLMNSNRKSIDVIKVWINKTFQLR
jgi:hypothetical protein